MTLWLRAGLLAILLLVVWTLLERGIGRMGGESKGKGAFAGLSPVQIWTTRLGLLMVFTAAIHASLVADHDFTMFRFYAAEMHHAVYAFAVTLFLLMSFPTLRILMGGAWVMMAVIAIEACQGLGLLPGRFRFGDILAGAAGVGAVVVPMITALARNRRPANKTPAQPRTDIER